MKKQNKSKKENQNTVDSEMTNDNTPQPDLIKKPEGQNLFDDPCKNRIEFDDQEMIESREELKLVLETTQSSNTEEVRYRPYKVSKRMSKKE